MIKINVRSLTSDPERYSTEIAPADLDLGPEWMAEGPARVECMLHRLGEKVFVKGSARVGVVMTCSRCLVRFEQPLEAGFMLVAVPKHHPAIGRLHERHTELEVADRPEGDEDQTVVVYSGDQLDLLPEVRSTLILALPMKPLCREDCPGLCAACGGRLVDGQCTCKHT